MPESAGDRIFAIRQALGTPRAPLALRAMADQLTARSGRKWDASELSKLERGLTKPTIRTLEDIAPLDPKQRGPWWIAWGVEVSGTVTGDSPVEDQPLPPARPVPRPAPEMPRRTAKG